MASCKAAIELARPLAPIVQELHKAGFVTLQATANELHKRNIKTVRGGRWHLETVARLLDRLADGVTHEGRRASLGALRGAHTSPKVRCMSISNVDALPGASRVGH